MCLYYVFSVLAHENTHFNTNGGKRQKDDLVSNMTTKVNWVGQLGSHTYYY